MLSQIIYVSNRSKSCTQEEIDKILISCNKNNYSRNITGILLYSETKFVQLIEGDQKLVSDLFEKIKQDERHSNAFIVSLGLITEKMFSNWHMAIRKLNEKMISFNTTITKDEQILIESLLSGKIKSSNNIAKLLLKFL